MGKVAISIPDLLDKLEKFYGKQEPGWPTDPYQFIVWWNCGYPPSDAACAKGWNALKREIGIEPRDLLAATLRKLAVALRPGGMVPELRASRLKEIAKRVTDKLGGDLRAALSGPISEARKTLKKFPGIADPGADRILLSAAIEPIAAVPSNATQVLVRIRSGREPENYAADYREAQQAIAAEVRPTFDARTRAYLLVKHHGQEICKRKNPRCGECPVNATCLFFSATRSRG